MIMAIKHIVLFKLNVVLQGHCRAMSQPGHKDWMLQNSRTALF
jgi:hypothetical protein